MSITEHRHVSDAEVASRRIEIFTGVGRRRSWTEHQKATIVAESFEVGVRASHVARRHGLTPQQLFAWRREAHGNAKQATDAPLFVPATVVASDQDCVASQSEAPESSRSRPNSIELDIEGASVFIWRDADAAMVTAIIGALKARK
jgi:transposase